MKPMCKPLAAANAFPGKHVSSLHFDAINNTLSVLIDGPQFGHATVLFKSIVGFRVLDERDLCEYWNDYSELNGWLYEVHSGGWIDLEKKRPLFNSHDFHKDLKEYFVVDDKCINVMTTETPEIIQTKEVEDA